MSIAISVLSKTSRGRMLLMAIVPIALIGVGTIAILQFFGDFNAIAMGCALTSGGVALTVFAGSVLRGSGGSGAVRLTIAEDGQLSLILYRKGPKDRFPTASRSEIVKMMPGSTLWPFFILLRLCPQNKKMIVMPFFGSDLSPQLFRRLSVACRWIAAQNDTPQSVYRADSD